MPFQYDSADKQTLNYYNEHAAETYRLYTSNPSPYKNRYKKVFSRGAKVLDIGCGSGRDVTALLESGYDAFGIDPSENLIKEAVGSSQLLEKKLQPGLLPDSLPEQWNHEEYWDGLLLSAVCQHIPDNLLFDSVFTIHRLLKIDGKVLITIPSQYSLVKEDRDDKNRLFRLRPAEEYTYLFERIGFQLQERIERPDSLNRPGISWTELLFKKKDNSGIRAIDKIESFIREDTKVSSYKFALLRALGETASTSARLARWQEDGSVTLPVDAVIHKWIEYYWPLLQTEEGVKIYQGQKIENKNDINFRNEMKELSAYWDMKENGWRKFKVSLEKEDFTELESSLYKKTFSKMKTAILKGPVKYMGNKKTGQVFEDLGSYIGVPADLWTEFSLMGRWFEDSLLFRWAEFCASCKGNRENNINISQILGRMISMKEVSRDVSVSKEIYQDYAEKQDLFCVWSDKKLDKKYALDHAIPYSLWRNNALWNLFPSNSKVNLNKSDKLPSRYFMKSRKNRIIEYWDMCYESEPVLFNRELQSLSGNIPYSPSFSKELFHMFCEQMEVLALQNVVERWEI